MMWTVVFGCEYLRRVRTKTFLLTTLLVPVGLVGIGAAVAGIFASAQSASEEARRQGVAVLDQSGRVLEALRRAAAQDADGGYRLFEASAPLAEAKRDLQADRHPVLLVLPPGLIEDDPAPAVGLYVKEAQPVLAQQALRRFVLGAVRELRLAHREPSPEVLAAVRERLAFNVVEIDDDGAEESSSAGASGAVATGIAMLIFVVTAIYGGTVMQAVMEEKSSRMAEVIVASAGAFDLLFGKILAVSAMAATQLGIWLLVLLAIGAAIGGLAAGLADGPGADGIGAIAASLPTELPSLRWDVAALVALMLPLGYLINASLFAAVGAMHENPWEAQMSVSLAMLPMILAVLVAQTMMLAPNGPMVVFGSFFPFTAPAILPARMVLVAMPWWQVAASVLLCAATAVGLVWLCGRIFRGSLLLYGKSLTWRDLRHLVAAD